MSYLLQNSQGMQYSIAFLRKNAILGSATKENKCSLRNFETEINICLTKRRKTATRVLSLNPQKI